MPPQSRGKRLGSHSQSTPNLQSIYPLRPLPEDAANLGHERNLSAPADDEDEHSQSSFERDFLSPTYSDNEDEDEELENTDVSDATASSVSAPKPAAHQPDARPSTTRTASQPAGQRPFYSQNSRSQSYLGPSTFAPPFYNRPPTPLPPSPSLTSLLRPSFSAQPSRPTTPDSSDTEATGTTNLNGTSSTAATITASARAATTVPRASPKVPTYEYYGFVLYLGSSLAFLVYILWSYLPTPFLHKIGVYYYPNRWWALAVPSWIVMLVLYIYIALAAYNTGYMTLKMGNLECLVDEASDVAVPDFEGRILRAKDRKGGNGGDLDPLRQRERKGSEKGKGGPTELEWRKVWSEGTDAVLDVPIGAVNEILYGLGRVEIEAEEGVFQ